MGSSLTSCARPWPRLQGGLPAPWGLQPSFRPWGAHPSRSASPHSNSWRRRLPSRPSLRSPCHRRPSSRSTAAWCRSSTTRTGYVSPPWPAAPGAGHEALHRGHHESGLSVSIYVGRGPRHPLPQRRRVYEWVGEGDRWKAILVWPLGCSAQTLRWVWTVAGQQDATQNRGFGLQESTRVQLMAKGKGLPL